MRILMCGSRTLEGADRFDVIGTVVEGLATNYPGTHVFCHGGAAGADTWAGDAAEALGFQVIVYKADWKTHGKAAGPIRNQRMLTEFKPDLVAAFVDKPLEYSRGTNHMVSIARKAGVDTIVVEVMR